MASPITRPPRLGSKLVYLPRFTITLLRTPFLPPKFASFIVPLRLNKLDIKDYLWNAYGVRVLSVRSFVQQQRVRHDNPRKKRLTPRRWFRPQSIKKMTVEMERPFVWPEEPEDKTAWDKETFDSIQKEAEKDRRDQVRPGGIARLPEDRPSIAEQARRLLSGEEKWRPQKELTPLYNGPATGAPASAAPGEVARR